MLLFLHSMTAWTAWADPWPEHPVWVRSGEPFTQRTSFLCQRHASTAGANVSNLRVFSYRALPSASNRAYRCCDYLRHLRLKFLMGHILLALRKVMMLRKHSTFPLQTSWSAHPLPCVWGEQRTGIPPNQHFHVSLSFLHTRSEHIVFHC